MGSYGSGGVPINKISEDIDKIQSALCHNEPYMINILSNRNSEAEWKLIKLLIEKNVHFAEASAFIRLSEPLVYYRLHGLEKNKDGSVYIKKKK
ncbi:MAG: malonyl CoA-ACP transacylase, partial [Oscillospiraceae bacterium]|nr:malonyl CoA-ACP transacylase [Oscillospiraceae bacterium]